MVVLNADHPDVLEFVQCKATEEKKAWALIEAGYDSSIDGEAYGSVFFQNANNSVRVTDDFMRAVVENRPWSTRYVTTEDICATLPARDLLQKIAEATWFCGDPGMQFDTTINAWHTCSNTGRINASNPCSEYMHLDDSACNLASLNLMKFLKDDGGFEVAKFVRSVELVITAMDISICFADFPTEKIGETTRAYRQLGIGYANLGALLMATGHPYDSESGRSVAAAITSLMTGTAYRRSAELAGVVGAYDGFARNAEPHKRVMRKHAAANDEIKPTGAVATEIVREATKQWTQGNKIGDKSGWRNAQASVLAPTGTIGLMMDCDTTGVEPDLALVKFKKLVGGGSMQIVNQTVPRALRSLGYPEEQVEAIVEHIADHGHVVDAPGLKPEHYPVFDCAMGERSIAPMGHVRMMAAVQPFISGAISKTVNMPEAATVADVEQIYFEGWKLGLKALAIYRDNCKVGQPLSRVQAGAGEGGPAGRAGEDGREGRRVPAGAQAAAEEAPVRDGVVLGRRGRGLPHRLVVPGRRAGRGLPQDVEAGLDAGRGDGRLLGGDLDRPAVRRAAGDVRQQVHQHAVRAGRDDRRPGHPDGGLGDGLHLPAAGPGLPAAGAAGGAGHLHRQGAGRAVAGGGGGGERRRPRRDGRVRAGGDQAGAGWRSSRSRR